MPFIHVYCRQVLKVLDKQGYYGDIYRAIELKKFLKTQ